MPQTTPAPAAQAKPRQATPPPEFQERDIATMDAAGLIGILKDASAPEFKKAKACQRIGELGAKEAVPALSALLSNEHLSTYARYGMEPIADSSVDDALRAALTKLKGDQLVGVINSIGKRRHRRWAASADQRR
jgi:HEAT repeat protein